MSPGTGAPALAFHHGMDDIDVGGRNFFPGTARPVYFELIDLSDRSEAEMHPLIGTGAVAAAAENVGALADSPGGEKHLGANGIARALGKIGRASCRERV